MAGDSLIERYLDGLDRRLGKRRDREDLVAEVADHLFSAAEGWEASGLSRTEAERRAVERFGRTDIVASVVTPLPEESGSSVVFLVRHVGAVCAAAAVAWLGEGVLALSSYFHFRGMYWDEQAYWTASVTTVIAILITMPALLAISVRARGDVDRPAVVTGVLCIVAAFMALTVLWSVFAWLLPVAGAVIWTFARTWRARCGSRLGTIATIALLALASSTVILLALMSSSMNPVVLARILFPTIIGTFAVLALGFADVALRVGYQAVRERALTA